MADYTVTDSRQMQTLTQAGTMKQMYRVWIVTGNGASGSVDVLPAQWNENDLPALLEVFALSLDLAFKVSRG